MSKPADDNSSPPQDEKLRLARQIAFVAGLFQNDVTVHTLLESLAEAVVIIDETGTILLVNRRAEELFGYARQDLVGRPHSILVPKRFRRAHQGRVARFFAGPGIRPMGHRFDLAARRRDGSEIPVEIGLSFLDTSSGVFALAFISDITIRKQYEAKLRESEELSHILVEGVKDCAIFMLDARGNVQSWNAGAEQIKGYRTEEVVGRHYSCFYPKEEREPCQPAEILARAAAEGHAEAEVRLVRSDGSRFWANVNLSALHDERGKLRGFSNVTRDITRHKTAEEALQETEKRLRDIVEHSTNLFYVHTSDHVLVYMSPQTRQFFDCEPQEALVRWTEFLTDNPINREAVEATQRAIDSGRRQPPYRVECIGRKGRKIWVEVNETPVVENGRTVAIVGSLTDITERKQAEDALRFSETRFRALFRDNPTMIVTLDTDWTILSANPFCAAQLGYEIDELEGRSVLELFQKDDRAAVEERLWECLQNPDQVYRWQFCKVRKDGESRWVEETAQAIYDLNGELNVLVVCQDITERKQAEEALRKSELKLTKIFHSVPALIGITTLADGRCVDINDRGLQTLGYRREEILGRSVLELGIWENPADRREVILALETEGKVQDLEINFRCRDGRTFTGLFSAELIDFDGDRFMLSIVKDISDRKRMEREIAQLNVDLAARAAELEEINREQKAFNYTVAHDLRKPLTVISGFCQVLREHCSGRLDTQCLGFLQEVYDGSLRMNRLIDALLDFSHLAHVQPRLEQVDLTAMAQEAAAELQLSGNDRRVEFRIADKIEVVGDSSLLRVVLDNLLGNAWKYTGGREEAVIEVGMEEADGETVIFVRDNGTGFDMGEADKLFLPFHRLSSAGDSEGFGVGLATVERIVRRHGGRVWSESEPDQGATFYFTLGPAPAAHPSGAAPATF